MHCNMSEVSPDSLSIFLKKISSLTDEDIDELVSLTTKIILPRGEFWIREGKRVDKVAFIEKGYLRKYFLKDGKELTDDFYFDNSFSADIPSIVMGRTAIANFVAMEETEILALSFKALEELST